MGRSPHKYRIKLSGKEKRELRQAKRKGCKDARLVIRILIILWADSPSLTERMFKAPI